MTLNKWMILSIVAIIGICAVKVYAGSLTMQSSYPAPTGYYDSVKVRNTLILPCYNTIDPSTHVAASIWTVAAGCTNP